MTTHAHRPLAIVTGASAGLGAEIADLLASRGHDLLVVARRQARLDHLAERLRQAHGVSVTPLALNLVVPTAAAVIRDAVEQMPGRLSYLVNCAGFNQPAPAAELPWSIHEALIRLGALAPIELTLALLPRLKQAGGARILNIASMAALRPGCPNVASYSASKTMLLRFCESLAAELEGSDVTVTVSCPGLIATEFFTSFVPASEMQTFMRRQARLMMPATLVARQAVDAADRGRLVVVHGGVNKVSAFLFKHLPDDMGRRLAAAVMRKAVISHATLRPDAI